jgi:hypothetical protein
MRAGYFSRNFTTTIARPSRWSTGPAPPRLPKEDQEIFEKLQQSSTGAFSTPRQTEPVAEAAEDKVVDTAETQMNSTRSLETEKMLEQLREKARVVAKGDGEELHPNVRRGAAPEFEGEVNPQTGEVGGPKNDPLRWQGDWSYNGRVTDF